MRHRLEIQVLLAALLLSAQSASPQDSSLGLPYTAGPESIRRAAALTATPSTITLNEIDNSGNVTLRNIGTETIRFQATVKTADGNDWLRWNPPNGELLPGREFPAGAWINFPGRAVWEPGVVYTGSITITLSTGGDPLVIPVRATWRQDLTIKRLEFVQVVQDDQQLVPLIAGKKTFARLFVGLRENTVQPLNGVSAELRSAFGTLQPMTAPIRAVPVFDRNLLSHSLNFELPDSWTAAGDLEVTAEIKPPPDLDEAYRPNNIQTYKVNFRPPPAGSNPFTVVFLRMCNQVTPADPPSCPGPTVSLGDMVEKMFPIPEGGFRAWEMRVAQTWPGILSRTQHAKLKAHLNKLYAFVEQTRPGVVSQLIGWLPPIPRNPVPAGGHLLVGASDPLWWESGRGRIGYAQDMSRVPQPLWDAATARRVVPAADGVDPVSPQLTLAHEIGHNMGLRHPSPDGLNPRSCGAMDPKTNWPRRADGSYWPTTTSDPGIDPRTREIRPGSLRDVMTFCWPPSSNIWISPLHYRRLIGSEMKPSFSPREAVAEGAEEILISGSVRSDGTSGRLDPAYRFPASGAGAASGSGGNHCLVFSNAESQTGGYCFDLSFTVPDPGPEEEPTPLDEQEFAFRVPYPAGTTRVALVREGVELAVLQSSGETPRVLISSPQAGDRWDGGGTRSIRWSGSSQGALKYSVLYSSDGGTTWSPLALDVTDTELSLEPSQIEGGNRVHFKVMASDGLNSAETIVGPVDVVQVPRIEVPSAIDFGTAPLEQLPSRQLALASTGTGMVTVTSIAVDNPAFQLGIPRVPFRLFPGDSFPLEVRLASGSVGEQRATVTISSDDPARPQTATVLRATITGPPVPSISVTPTSLDFGSALVGQERELSVTVRNTGQAALRVTSLESGSGQFIIPDPTPFSVGAGESRQLRILFRPTAAGTHSGVLTLRSNDPAQPAVTVALAGKAEAAPVAQARLELSPATLDFGSVTVGRTKDLIVTLRLIGDRPVVVSALTIDNPRFSIVSPAVPFTVGLMGSAAVSVRFSPDAATQQNATLTIRSDATGQPTLSVPLSGKGEPAGPQSRVLQVDDGVFERVAAAPENSVELFCVNRLTPPSYPATLTKIQLYFHPESTMQPGTGIGLLAGTMQADVAGVDGSRLRGIAARVPRIGQWVEFDVPPITIESGDFVVGFYSDVTSESRIATIDITTSSGRSFVSTDGRNFSFLSLLGLSGNLAIRAAVTLGGP